MHSHPGTHGVFLVHLLVAVLLSSCASSRPRGRVLRAENSFSERKTEPSRPDSDPDPYAVSRRGGSSIEVPSAAEDAAIFHFSLGQAYSLDNDPQRAIESYRATLVHDPKSALVRARLAAELVKLGGFSEARVLCEEAIALDPSYIDSYLLLAGIQVAAKEYEAAIATYTQALKREPRNKDALLYLGVTLAEVGRVKAGIEELEKLVKLKDSSDSNIDQSVAHYYLAKILDQHGQKEKAIRAYRSALKKRPGLSKAALALSDLHLARKEPAQAYAVLEEAFTEGRSAEIAERLAERHLEKNDYKGSVKYLEALVEEDPANENMKLRLSLVYWQLRWHDKARILLTDLHQRYPGSSEISYYLGELELERGDFAGAMAYYRQVSTDYAKFETMVGRVAYVYRQQKQFVAAEDYLIESLRKRPDLISFYPLLAAVYEDQKKLEEARLVLERGERSFPNDESILYYLGFLLDRLGQKKEALGKMERLLTVNPDNPNALNFVGYTLLELGRDLPLAQRHLEKAVRLKPDDAFILDSYGWLLYRSGQRHEAMKQLEKAFAAKPEEGVIGEHLADVYVALNLPRKALLVYEQALKAGGDGEFVARVEGKLANLRSTMAAMAELPAKGAATGAVTGPKERQSLRGTTWPAPPEPVERDPSQPSQRDPASR